MIHLYTSSAKGIHSCPEAPEKLTKKKLVKKNVLSSTFECIITEHESHVQIFKLHNYK